MIRSLLAAVGVVCLVSGSSGYAEEGAEPERVLQVVCLAQRDRQMAVQRDAIPRTTQAVLDGVSGLRVLYRPEVTSVSDAHPLCRWILLCRYGQRTEGHRLVRWELCRPDDMVHPLANGEAMMHGGDLRDLILSCREAAADVVDSVIQPLGLPGDVLEGQEAGAALDPELRALLERLDERSLVQLINSKPGQRPSAAHHLAIAEAYGWLAEYSRYYAADTTFDFGARAVGHYNAAALLGASPDLTDPMLAFVLMAMGQAGEGDVVIQEAIKRGAETPKAHCIAGWIRSDPTYASKRAEQEPHSVAANMWAGMTFSRSGAKETAEVHFGRAQQLNHHFMHALLQYVDHTSVGPARQHTTLAIGRVLHRDLSHFLSQDWLSDDTKAKAVKRLWAASGNSGPAPATDTTRDAVNRVFAQYAQSHDTLEVLKPYKWLCDQAREQAPALSPERLAVRDYLALSRAQVSETVWSRFSVLCYSLGVPEWSRKFIDAFVAIYPEEPVAHYLAGSWHNKNGKWQDARRHYQMALSAQPAVWLNVLLVKRTGAELRDVAIHSLGPELGHSPWLIREYTSAFRSPDRDGVLIKWLSRSLELDPYVASVYERLAKLTGKTEHLEKAISVLPHSSSIQLAAARAHYRGDPDRAMVHFRRCIELNPREHAAYLGIGDLLYRHGKYEEAIGEYGKYLEVDSSSLRAVHTRNRIGKTYLKMDRAEDALSVYEIAAPSWQHGAMVGLARTYERLGRYPEAETWFRRAAERYSRGGPKNLFGFYARRGRIAEAEEVMRKKVKSRLSRLFRRSIAGMYIYHDSPEKLLEFYAKTFPSRDATKFAHVGAAHLAAGRAKEAADNLRQAFVLSAWNQYGFLLCSALIDVGDIPGALKALRKGYEKATQRDTPHEGVVKAYQFLLGELGEHGFVGEANKIFDEGLVCYYRALRARAQGKPEATKSLLVQCLAHTDYPLLPECALAKARLKRMGCEDLDSRVEDAKQRGVVEPTLVDTEQSDREWQELVRAQESLGAEKLLRAAAEAFGRAMALDAQEPATSRQKVESWRQYLRKFEETGHEVAKARERLVHWQAIEAGEKLDNPTGRKLMDKVTLQKPYPRPNLSLQFAVMELLKQVGVRYNFRQSYTNTNPLCRRWAHPNVKEKPCYQALDELLDPLGLTYEIEGGQVVLVRK